MIYFGVGVQHAAPLESMIILSALPRGSAISSQILWRGISRRSRRFPNIRDQFARRYRMHLWCKFKTYNL